MDGDLEAELSGRLRALLPEPARGAIRFIRSYDEQLLTPAEAAQCAGAVDKVRRQRGAARHLARSLLRELGLPPADILRGRSGEPLWPAGVVGSMSHDDSAAAVVLSQGGHGLTLGVDIEPVDPLPAELVSLIAKPEELDSFGALVSQRLLFAVKEAVFKAVFPQDRAFLEFHDIFVDPKSGMAETCYGRRIRWRACERPRVLAVAWTQTG
jgi:4'-phosphopantetheinyl transferase EntD